MLDPLLALGLALAGGAALALSPVWAAAAALGLTLALRRRASALVLAVALLAFAAAGARSLSAIHGAERRYDETVALLSPPSRCVAEGVVASSPVVVTRADSSEQLGDARVDLELERGTCDDRSIGAHVRARVYGAPRDLGRGDRVTVIVDLAPVYLFRNEGLASPWPSIARGGVTASGGLVDLQRLERGVGIAAWIDRARAAVRLRIEATFAPDAAPLARALVLGEEDLAPEDDGAFRVSGLAHLLAVSGTHLVVAVLGLCAAMRAIAVRIGPIAARGDANRLVSFVAIPLTWIYSDFAGGSGSAVRAAAMLTAVLGAQAIGRRATPGRSLGWALAGTALFDPLVACDVSFALSAAATAGLVALGGPIAARVVRGPAPIRKLLAPVAATLAATIACAPVMALIAPTLPLLGVAANVVAAPIGELVALPVCLLHATLGGTGPVERGAALLGSGALLAVRWVARVTAASGATIAVPPPTSGEMAALTVAIGAIWAAPTRRRRAVAALASGAALIALELGAHLEGAPKGRLRVTVLDVGQGDSILVDLPDGRAMLIDGGGFVGSPVDPGQRVLLPLLRARRRSRIDVAVMTHPHPDHFGGLASALPELDVGELWDTGQGEAEGAGSTYAGLLAGLRRRGIPVRRPAELCGTRSIGGAMVDVIAPCPGPVRGQGANDNSFVLRVTFGARSALLVGDAEHGEEERLLASTAGLGADFLKVGHHGSRTSSSQAFLAAVHPAIAAISTGVRNRFGHPHPTTLQTLFAASIPVDRTDRGGAIAWQTDGVNAFVTRP